MLEDAHENGHPFRLHGVTKANQAALEEIMPGAFTYQPYRDGFDYIYNTQDLIALSGRKYHGKRNHIASFQKRIIGTMSRLPRQILRIVCA